MTIGSWVRRPDQKWHRVESIIADEPVTHCGRRLKTRYATGSGTWGSKVAFEEEWDLDERGERCRRCV